MAGTGMIGRAKGSQATESPFKKATGGKTSTKGRGFMGGGKDGGMVTTPMQYTSRKNFSGKK